VQQQEKWDKEMIVESEVVTTSETTQLKLEELLRTTFLLREVEK